MAQFDQQFPRNLDRDEFADIMIRLLQEAGESRAIEYDVEKFRLLGSNNNVYLMENSYARYHEAEDTDRAEVLRSFLVTWFSNPAEIPDDLTAARRDILPIVKPRAHFTVDAPLVSGSLDGNTSIPFKVFADHLAVAVAYDLPRSIATITSGKIEEWRVGFDEVLELAEANLRDMTESCVQADGLFVFANGDGYDASRILLTDVVRELEVDGDPIAMSSSRDCLSVAGSNDVHALKTMCDLAEKAIEQEQFTTGLAFRLVNDEWEVWLPPVEHESHDRFKMLEILTCGTAYGSQAELLKAINARDGSSIDVAGYSAVQDESTGARRSYCAWTASVETLLPRTDLVLLLNQKSELVSAGTWETVQRHAGYLMERQGAYPERWRVAGFPTENELQQIGQLEGLSVV